MGGRGSSSGATGGGGGMVAAFQSNQNNPAFRQGGPSYGGLQGVWAPGYDDNGNPNLLKWQGQTDDKAARYLAKVHNDYTFVPDPNDWSGESGTYVDPSTGQNVDTSGYNFYKGDFQRFSLAQGLDAKPVVLSEAEFDKYVQQTGAQVVYRGETGQKQCDRFMYADKSHTGIGNFGDGYYFSQDVNVANRYAQMKGGSNGRVLKMALAPSARITDQGSVISSIHSSSSSLRSALGKQGQSNSGGYNGQGEAQMALKQGYNVISVSSTYHYGITRDAFVVCEKTKHKW